MPWIFPVTSARLASSLVLVAPFAATEKDVKAILDGLDPKVDTAFTDGEAAARKAFETFVDGKMRAYKKDRYGGWLGGLRWAKDKLLGMPEKVNEFYAAGRELYLKQMDGVISRVADVVAADLTAAKKRIATGRAEIATYVKTLPADLQKVGSEASKEIGDRFAQLESDVTAKQEAVVDTLATKYAEARKGLDERIEALQAENKGLVDKAIGAIKAVINTIRELAAMLRNVLSRVAGVVGDIVKAPVKFLGNLIAGVKGGILKFKDNILDHLRKGLMSWLFGALAEAGVELPEKFDLMGIIKLLASLFGLTWTNIRNRIVKQVGETAMAAIEKGVEIFSVLRTQGVAGLWQMLMDKLGDIKEMILEQVKDFVITKIITAGITWLIGLLNPAAAFIKACKMIYDIVMFFVDNGSRILKFVNTVIDSVADIVKGNVSGVVNKINDVLGQMVPIIIGFLASLIGLGGIGQKIRAIVETLQKPITKALDFVIKTGLKLAGPIIRGIKGISGKVKAKVAAGKAYVKGKVEAGKQWAKTKVYGGDDSAEGRQKRLEKGMKAGVGAVNRLPGRIVGSRALSPILAAIRMRYGVGVLEPVAQGRTWAVHGEVQRMTAPTEKEVEGKPLRPTIRAELARLRGQGRQSPPALTEHFGELRRRLERLDEAVGEGPGSSAQSAELDSLKSQATALLAMIGEHHTEQLAGHRAETAADRAVARKAAVAAVDLLESVLKESEVARKIPGSPDVRKQVTAIIADKNRFVAMPDQGLEAQLGYQELVTIPGRVRSMIPVLHSMPDPDLAPLSFVSVGADHADWPEISATAPDWGQKGAHIQIDAIELSVDANLNVSYVFSRDVETAAKKRVFEQAKRKAEVALAQEGFQRKLYNAVLRAMGLNPGMTLKSPKTGTLDTLARALKRRFDG